MGEFHSFVRLMLGSAKRKVRPPGPGPYAVPVVGESHYQGVLEGICGGRTEGGVEEECEAELIPEDDNRYDAKAVRVEISTQIVGYLARPDASDYRKRYAADRVRCAAVIRGGWDRGPDDRGHFGVYLDLDLT